MSDLRDLRNIRDATEYLFKQVCQLSAENKNLARLQVDFGDIFGRLVWAAAEEEALSPTTQEKRECAEAAPKGSSVEYYRDRLVRTINACVNSDSDLVGRTVREALRDYKRALAAYPDPEGSWEWVPKGWLIAPKIADNKMRAAGYGLSDYPYQVYNNMIAARPPVPKKGERV